MTTVKMKRTLVGAVSVCATVVALGLYFAWTQEWKGPRRVFFTYAEKYHDSGDIDITKDWPTDNKVFAEEQLLNMNHSCFVLTRNKAKADYLVNIQVTRFVGGELFGKATLEIVKP